MATYEQSELEDAIQLPHEITIFSEETDRWGRRIPKTFAAGTYMSVRNKRIVFTEKEEFERTRRIHAPIDPSTSIYGDPNDHTYTPHSHGYILPWQGDRRHERQTPHELRVENL